MDEIYVLKAQNIELRRKLEELKNKAVFLEFISWISTDMKIKNLRKKIYDQQK